MSDYLLGTRANVERLPGLVRECRTAEAALARLVEAIDPEFPIHRASLRRIDLVNDVAVVVAVSTVLRTVISPGLDVPLRATSYHQALRRGGSVLSDPENETLLDHLLKEEGVRSWVTIPLFEGHQIRGLVSFCSWRAGAFTEGDLNFFDGLGLAVAGALLPFLRD